MALAAGARRGLIAVLERARGVGALGRGPVEEHIGHGEGFVEAVGAGFSGRFVDLGSGGGVPGLILLTVWPEASGTLVESQLRRCAALEVATGELGLGGRAVVACGRAEELARRAHLRHGHDLVVARAFGSPAITAECAVGFLRVGGRLVVSEPPGGGVAGRWRADGLAALGLGPAEIVRTRRGTFAVMQQGEAADERWPRRTGVPARRPLWS